MIDRERKEFEAIKKRLREGFSANQHSDMEWLIQRVETLDEKLSQSITKELDRLQAKEAFESECG